jgi:hypothetical protein
VAEAGALNITMPRIRVTLDFPLNAFYVEREVLGTTWDVKVGKHDVTVRFPAEPAEFIEGEPRDWDVYAIGHPSSGFVWDPGLLVSVNVVRVTVEFDEADPPRVPPDYGDDPRWSELVNRGTALLDGAEAAAKSVLQGLLAWARIKGPQAWLGLEHDAPERFGVIRMVDTSNPSEKLAYAVRAGGGTMRHDSSALSPADMVDIFEKVRREEESPIAEGLLIDSQHFAWHLKPPDAQRAVLTAAIACELKVKRSLREATPEEKQPLLDLILRGRRPVKDFFGLVFAASLGVSRADDEPSLFQDVGRLFTTRNGIAHRGERVSPQVASKLVGVATRAFAWVEDHA